MMSTSGRIAFDNCPKRTLDVAGGVEYMVCPRYSRGIELPSRTFSDEVTRKRFASKLGCNACSFSQVELDTDPKQSGFEGFHSTIAENCQPKFEAGHYDDAALTGILIVRDRLRELTTYETASDAFGKGGLIIAGSANTHTENNFQEGAKMLMMANDRFRNELAHTNDQNDYIKHPGHAMQFISISSLSMYMLDGARVPEA